MIDIGSLYTRIEADTSPLQKAESDISAFAKKAAGMLAAAFAVDKITSTVTSLTMAAARYNTLGVVMETVGKTAGYSAQQMAGFQQSLEKTGISMTSSRETLTKMVQAQLSLTKSSELARIAQDAAVIGNINSSEAFERMIYGIQSGQIEALRTIGINVNFEQSYVKLAATLNKSVSSLSEQEKATARMNAVLEQGKTIAGAYEAAMDTPMKKWLSMTRYVDNLKVSLGQVFQSSFGTIVDSMTSSMKNFQASLDAKTIKDWGESINSVVKGSLDFASTLKKYTEEFAILIPALVGAKVAQIAFNFAVKANPYILAASALVFLNEQLKSFGMNIGSLPSKASEFSKTIQNIVDVLSGNRDANTGKILSEVDKIEKKIASLKNQKAVWSIFPDQADMARHAQETKTEIEKLQKAILEAKIKDVIKESIEDPWKSSSREAVIAQRAIEAGLASSVQTQARSLKTLQEEYEKHKETINKINDEIKQNQMSGEELIRSIQQSGMSDIDKWKDLKKQAGEYAVEAQKAYEAAKAMKDVTSKDDVAKRNTFFEDAEKYADLAKGKYAELKGEVKSGDQTLISQQQGIQEAIAGIKQMIDLKDQALKSNANMEAAAANALVAEGGSGVGPIFEEIKTKSNDLITQTFPQVTEAFVKVWDDGKNAANIVFTNIEQQADATKIKLDDIFTAIPQGQDAGLGGLTEKVEDVAKSWIQVGDAAKESAEKGTKLQSAFAKVISEKVQGLGVDWSDVWEEAGRAAEKATEQMLDQIERVKQAAASIKYPSPSSSSSDDEGYMNGGLIQRLHDGGRVIMAQAGRYFPGYGGGDKIPIMGEAGEVMIKKESVKGAGLGTALAFNKGDWKTVVSNLSRKLMNGGPVSPSFPRLAFAAGGELPSNNQAQQSDQTARKYFIQGSAEPISVSANDYNADRLFNQLQKKYQRRSR